jgi:dTMP kinase
MKKGKLIVIDGTDGSGKATQVALLEARLKKEGHTVKLVDFPEYYKNFFGKFIGHCLSEQYYNFINVHPKIASVLYAADRFESKVQIEGWLAKGYIVLANRYVSANQIHQGGKIANAKKRVAYLRMARRNGIQSVQNSTTGYRASTSLFRLNSLLK